MTDFIAEAREADERIPDPEPSPRGYWLACSQSPNVSPYKRHAAELLEIHS